MEKELDRIQGGRLCFRIVGGSASAQETDMGCADLSKEEIERADCTKGILEKEAAALSGCKVVPEVEDACEIVKQAPWVLDQAP